MKEIVIATKNPGKAKEFADLLSPMGIQVRTLLDYPDAPDVEETGTTFEENALLKAREISEVLGVPVLADDSGMTVDALDGRPGVYSARYAGLEKDDVKNYQKVLAELADVPENKRTACFYCAIAFVRPNGEEFVVHGTVDGRVLFEPIGTNGFGYDPIFYVVEKGKSFAQCTKEEKNAISHRAKAMKAMLEALKERV